jgi:cytochrome c-type biogenesis protein CcmH
LRSRSLLLALLVAGLSLAQVSSELMTPEVKRVGMRLACLCGSCKNAVGDCPMLECHYSKPARETIRNSQGTGMGDDQIVANFVKQEGKRALVVPPAEGFSGLTWWIPPVMVGFGLAGVYWFIRRAHRPDASPEVDAVVMDRYKDSIEKDLAKLD